MTVVTEHARIHYFKKITKKNLIFFLIDDVAFVLGHACTGSRFGHVQLFATLWTVAHQAPLFMGFPRQEDWSGKANRGVLTCF